METNSIEVGDGRNTKGLRTKGVQRG